MASLVTSRSAIAGAASPSLSRADLRPAATVFRECLHQRRVAAFSRYHGLDHWRGVVMLGLALSQQTPGADPLVAAIFGMFHDIERHDDGVDPHHGARAAELLRGYGASALGLSEHKMTLLLEACSRHSDGMTHADPTIGVCWDADRLTLWRVGTVPSARFLSTAAARNASAIAAGKRVVETPPRWREALSAPGVGL